MKVIVHPGLTAETMTPPDYAREVAQRGLGGIYLPEHTHIPVNFIAQETGLGVDLPDRYRRLLDPYVALAVMAAAEPDIEVGTCVSLVGQRDPIVLAKEIATLDLISGGRFVLGVGMGWSSREFESHRPGLAGRRGAVVAECVSAMKAIWTNDTAQYDGTYVQIPPLWSWPKPVSTPHPPVLLGGDGSARTFGRVVEWADGWISRTHALFGPQYPAQLAELADRWRDAGRSGRPQAMALEEPGGDGHPAAAVERALELGLDRLILHVEDRPRDELLPILDAAAVAVARHCA